MSLSTSSSTPPQDKAKLSSHLPVSPIRPVPALEKKPATADPAPQNKPVAQSPKPEQKPASPAPEQAKQASTPKDEQAQKAPAAAEKTAATAAPRPQQAKPTAGKLRWQDALLDTLLVTLVVGVLAGGGYFIKTQRDLYRVPGAVEQMNAQCLELCQQREALQDDANHADEQLHMRRKLAALEDKLRQFSEESALRTAAINEQQNRVLALQHEIRRADKEARNVARGLMPGLYVGDVTTTRGKLYTEATISRIEGKRISLRTPYGAASMPINELVKDNLPDIALYALGLIDLVDMRDFSADGSAPAATYTPSANKLRTTTPRRSSGAAPADYEPSPTGPVVDTANLPMP